MPPWAPAIYGLDCSRARSRVDRGRFTNNKGSDTMYRRLLAIIRRNREWYYSKERYKEAPL